jgi:serine O-acetyltransferase
VWLTQDVAPGTHVTQAVSRNEASGATGSAARPKPPVDRPATPAAEAVIAGVAR